MESSRSGNSKSNSKRSRNSNSSSVNSDGKRGKCNQKTLGAAWGANSTSSSRSSFRQAPFSDFGSYMALKNQKLHEQFDAEASTSSLSGSDAAKPIFQGVSIFVDGFTIPSSQELRAYMLKHGGRFENYFSRHSVTHIICSNLAKSKIKNIRSFSRGLPVVKPTWVVDSVLANKLLNWTPYQLDQLADEMPDQPKLSDFLMVKSRRTINDVHDASDCTLKNEAEYRESMDSMISDKNLQEVDESTEVMRFPIGQGNDTWHGVIHATNVEGLISGEKDDSQVDTEKSCPEGASYNILNDELPSAAPQPSALVNSHFPEKDYVKSSSSSLAAGPSGHHHSTIEDPSFVENYFKRSRLHFIGTWRNRYRKRFVNLSRGIKDTNSGDNASSMQKGRTIIHVDMDCFFVAVVIRNRPELHDKPVAVCHSDSAKGTAEISSANYPARDYGVRAGMFVRDAKALCPHLVTVPYNFEAYEEVADVFYDILHKHSTKVQAVSCDEAFLDVTGSEEKDPEHLASIIRKEIFDATGCSASVGISGNLLMARLATRSAKPDGQCYIPPDKVDEHLLQLPIKTLPGIGRVLEEKLKKKQIQTCGQLRMISKESLQKDFGAKTGEMLWNYSRGVDNRVVGVIQESKSVGAEVNWGVRFKDAKDFDHFISSLCKEVSLRLQGCGVQGRNFTLKIKKRRKDAGEPTKYMGCGDCENLSHSTTVPVAVDDVEVLKRIALQLFGFFHIVASSRRVGNILFFEAYICAGVRKIVTMGRWTDLKDIRGVGLQVSKLENVDYSNEGHGKGSLRSWLGSAAVHTREEHKSQSPEVGRGLRPQTSDSSNHEAGERVSALPSLADLDIGVIESLPPDLFSEINDMYGGKLMNFINKKKAKIKDRNSLLNSNALEEATKGAIFKEDDSVSCANQVNNIQEKEQIGCSEDREVQTASDYSVRSAAGRASHQGIENFDFMPSSLSQVDVSVLRQLPEELRADIIQKLPEHRKADRTPHAAENCTGVIEDQSSGLKELGSFENLWHGSPPSWVIKFNSSHCLLLKAMAEMYFMSGSAGQLSCILQSFFSQVQVITDLSYNETEEASTNLCELIKQYVKLKIETDIEELYVCFRLLKRYTSKSKALLQVYNELLPYLQAAAAEVYGGNLHLSL